MKGLDVYVPACDRQCIDWSLIRQFDLKPRVPAGFESITGVLDEVDVLWIAKGSNRIEGLFEVEHSTPIYSGLLRFNDALLVEPQLDHFFIVSNDTRRELFGRQVYRPTFRRSGLSERTSLLEYANVLDWHARVTGGSR